MLRHKSVGVDYTQSVNQVSALKYRHSNVFRPENICIPTFSNLLTKCGTSQCDFDLFSLKAQIVAVTMVRSLKRQKGSLEIPLAPFKKGGTLSVQLQILK